MDPVEPVPRSGPDQVFELDELDQKYQPLSGRFKALGETIFRSDEVRNDYFLGIVSGFRKLTADGKDTGQLPGRDLTRGHIPFIDHYYEREANIFKRLIKKADEQGDTEYRREVTLEINKRISKMQKDEGYKEYFTQMWQQGQSRPHHLAFLLGASMIRDFVSENAQRYSPK